MNVKKPVLRSCWNLILLPLAAGAVVGALLVGGRAVACTCLGDHIWQLSKLEQQPDAPPGEEALWPAQGFLSPDSLNLRQPGTELVLRYGVEAAP